MAYCQVRRAMAQREKWLEEQRLVPAMRRECGVKIAAVLVLHVLGLEVEEDLASVVALVEEVQVVQHGGVIEHVVHDLVPQEAAELPDQLERELVGRVNFSPPSL